MNSWSWWEWLFYIFGLGLLVLAITGVITKSEAQDLKTSEKLYNIRHDVPNKRIQNLADYINTYSMKYNVDKNLVIAIIDVESDLYNVRGPTGESGYVQIKPNTFKQACGYETTLDKIIYDVKEQIRCGIKHISDLQKRYDWYSAISAYNSGTPTKHNSEYVIKVLTEYNELQ